MSKWWPHRLLAAVALMVTTCAPLPREPSVPSAALPTATVLATPQPTIIRPLTATPEPLGRHVIYVVDPRNGELLSQILVVDPDTRRVVRGLRTRASPEIAFSPDGQKVYVADSYQSRVIRGESHDVFSVYDPVSGQLLHDDVEIPQRLLYKLFPGGGVGNLIVSRDGRRLFVGQYGDPDIHALRLAVLDAEQLKTLSEFKHPCGASWLFPLQNGNLLCAGSGQAGLFDPSSGKTAPVPGSLPAESAPALSSSGDRLYLVSYDARAPAAVTVVDLASSPPAVLAERVPLDIPSGFQPSFSVASGPDESRLYVGVLAKEHSGSGTADEIEAFNTRTWQRVGQFKPTDPAWHFAVSNDGTQLYTVNPFKKSLSILDTATFREIAVMHDLGETPAQIVVPPER